MDGAENCVPTVTDDGDQKDTVSADAIMRLEASPVIESDHLKDEMLEPTPVQGQDQGEDEKPPTPPLSTPTLSTPMVIDDPPSSNPQNNERPLNVTDALSYLDEVKIQFANQPDVYNRFLDIMKEFKTQTIDTPGVIQRVSHLFTGHPSLIQGFNTFLPVGYRIECSTDAQDSNLITVTTPTGTTIQSTNNGELGQAWLTQDASIKAPEPEVQPQTPPLHTVQSPEPQTPEKPMEPALKYVQKIKERCDAETYKHFLDILAQYHKRPELVEEQEAVSRRISRLFKDDPDLRSEFRIFMPERGHSFLDYAEEHTRGKRKQDSSAASTLPQKRKRKVEKEREPPTLPPPPPPAKQQRAKKAKPPAPPPEARRIAQPLLLPVPLPAPTPAPVLDETQFFDRVRRALGSRDTYNEFLKVVNLFTQGFIDTIRLIKESRTFLEDGELMRQWKEILGWDERRDQEIYLMDARQRDSWTRPTVVGLKERPSRVEMQKMYGSYRKIPQSDADVPCSGRDEMCKSVLNDEWVSHPTWTNEDIGFMASRKNIYEEALHRSEEERHEYDFHLEGVSRTIALLEPLNNKMVALPIEERDAFKFKTSFTKPIHHRVIKKIYGRDVGNEVIRTLHDAPFHSIPVVLHRLKQKEDEWKRAQKEWNKVWKEVDARNYAKSLDHQGITFKVTDKKSWSTKSFINQIEAAREEQMAKRASMIDPLFARTRPRHQLEYTIDEIPVLQDALKLTLSFLDRTQAQIHHAERRRIEVFLRSVVPVFFMLDPVEFNSVFVAVQESADGDISDVDISSIGDEVEAASTASGSSKNGRGRKGASNVAGDLRKKLLKSEQAKSTVRKTRARDVASPAVSRMASPTPIETDALNENGVPRKGAKRNIFFTNTPFYVLLRLLEVLYSRLSLFKEIGLRLAALSRETGTNPVLSTYGINPDELMKFGNRSTNAEHFYDLMLESCERLFDNEVEQHVFEDQMRYMFGVKQAYRIFTVDKLVGTLIKQVQVVIADGKSQELLENLKQDRALQTPTTQDIINSRRNADRIIGPDENLFRIDWLPDSKVMTIQLLGKDDSSYNDSELLTGRWQSYLDSFVSTDKTEGIVESKLRRPFLHRNIVPAETPNVVTSDGLEIKVCVRTYRLFFVSNTGDYLWKIRDPEDVEKMQSKLKARDDARQRWIQDSLKAEQEDTTIVQKELVVSTAQNQDNAPV